MVCANRKGEAVMDVHEFYNDIAEWVMMINQQAPKLSEKEYWDYILVSAGALSKKHNDTALVKHILNSHIDFLEKSWKQQRTA